MNNDREEEGRQSQWVANLQHLGVLLTHERNSPVAVLALPVPVMAADNATASSTHAAANRRLHPLLLIGP
jgi:hypothetical protein